MRNKMNKPFSQSCENNKQPILNVLSKVFKNTKHVLEIGSGTGQHAVYFGQHLPHLTWQTSDLQLNHAGINSWVDESALTNVHRPFSIDLNRNWSLDIPDQSKSIDGLFTANTLHIISWPLVVKFFQGIKDNLINQASVCIYGPFNYQGKFTSESNEKFDLWLKDRDNESGIRDIESVLSLANAAGLNLIDDHEMPANNRLLVFSKKIK